jgi:hypothetical protein
MITFGLHLDYFSSPIVFQIFLSWPEISNKVIWLCLQENGEARKHLGFGLQLGVKYIKAGVNCKN